MEKQAYWNKRLAKYLQKDEKLIMVFGTAWTLIVAKIAFWTLVLAVYLYFGWGYPAIAIMGGGAYFFAVLIYLLKVWSTVFFVTDVRIYRRGGLFFVSLVSATKDEVLDTKVVQGFWGRFIFRSGTLLFNTAGSALYEVILENVYQPFEKKKFIADYWDGNI